MNYEFFLYFMKIDEFSNLQQELHLIQEKYFKILESNQKHMNSNQSN